MAEYKTFNPLNVSSKFAICGLPIRVDTYKTCSFACKYCFSNCRKIMEFDKHLQIGNVHSVQKKLCDIFDENKINSAKLLDTLINQRYDWHCGGMSDPFQPIENTLHITKQLIDITNKYDIHILFSTKADTVYNADIRLDLHTFQLSVTNTDNRTDIEPNVPDIQARYQFFQSLKKDGFKVGIRIQPFIPGATSLDIIDMFHDADNFTIEGLKIVPQNKEHKEYLFQLLHLNSNDFTQMGLLNLKPEIRLKLYKPFIEELQCRHIPYSIADNDLHQLGTNCCCCGDALINIGKKGGTHAYFDCECICGNHCIKNITYLNNHEIKHMCPSCEKSNFKQKVSNDEVFVPINGYEDYSIGNYGTAISYKNGYPYVMTPWLDGNGKYYYIDLCKGGKIYKKPIHQLVAYAFVDGYQDGFVPNHIDTNTYNNCATNLEWVTQRENTILGYKTMPPNRNRMQCILVSPNGEKKQFNCIKDAVRYGIENNLPFSPTGISRYLHSNGYKIVKLGKMSNVGRSGLTDDECQEYLDNIVQSN